MIDRPLSKRGTRELRVQQVGVKDHSLNPRSFWVMAVAAPFVALVTLRSYGTQLILHAGGSATCMLPSQENSSWFRGSYSSMNDKKRYNMTRKMSRVSTGNVDVEE